MKLFNTHEILTCTCKCLMVRMNVIECVHPMTLPITIATFYFISHPAITPTSRTALECMVHVKIYSLGVEDYLRFNSTDTRMMINKYTFHRHTCHGYYAPTSTHYLFQSKHFCKYSFYRTLIKHFNDSEMRQGIPVIH